MKSRHPGLIEILTRRAVELLDDGQWHDYEAVRAQMMKLIPPGIAWRKAEQIRLAGERQRRREGAPEMANPRRTTREIQVESGRKHMVSQMLENSRIYERDKLTSSGRPQTGGGSGRRIRMIAQPRLVKGDFQRQRAERLELEIIRLKDQIVDLRKYLVEIGHADVAERLAPETNEVLNHPNHDNSTRASLRPQRA